jgi:phosphate starvation-inducible protein PhoH
VTARATRASLELAPLDNRALANLCGPLDVNLRQIEAACDVMLAHRAGAFTLDGSPVAVGHAKAALMRFYRDAHDTELSVDDIQLGLVEILRSGKQTTAGSQSSDEPSGPSHHMRNIGH